MLSKLFKKQKKTVGAPIMHSPIYCDELMGVMYQRGEFIPHARMRVLFEKRSTLGGMAFKGEETLFFVASHPRVISHIQLNGLVPLSQTQHLHFFRSKKQMNTYLSKVNAA